MKHELKIDRRTMMLSLLAISSAGALLACQASPEDKGASSSVMDLSFASPGNFFGAKELALITALGNAIIPDTDTAGAGNAGVATTLQRLVSDWADDNFKSYWRGGLDKLSGELTERASQDFMQIDQTQRTNILAKYDSEVFAGLIKDDFYGDMKTTIATAYYMSEVGASQELIYDPVPGDWIGEVPFSDIGKTWAT